MNKLILNTSKRHYILVLLLASLLLGCKNETKTTTGGFTSEMTKSDKKKYYDSNQTVVYEVKYKDDSFKLRTASSDLLWKVKLYEKKVKISDNEENLNPYEIKKLDSGESKLEKNDTTIERSTAAEARSLVYKIDVMPKEQQEIIITELKEKGF